MSAMLDFEVGTGRKPTFLGGYQEDDYFTYNNAEILKSKYKWDVSPAPVTQYNREGSSCRS